MLDGLIQGDRLGRRDPTLVAEVPFEPEAVAIDALDLEGAELGLLRGLDRLLFVEMKSTGVPDDDPFTDPLIGRDGFLGGRRAWR